MQSTKTSTSDTNNKNTTTNTTSRNSMRGQLSPPNARSGGVRQWNPLGVSEDASLGASDAFASFRSGARHA